MASQGRTVDHSLLLLVDGPIDAAGLYVPMARGRICNEAGVVADPTLRDDLVDLLADVMQRRWIDEPAIEHLPDAEMGVGPCTTADIGASTCEAALLRLA